MKNLKTFIPILMMIGFKTIFAQQMTITGIVTDRAGQSISGINVSIKGTNISTLTDFDGSYSIKALKGQTLKFSFISSPTISKEVTNSDKINIAFLIKEPELIACDFGFNAENYEAWQGGARSTEIKTYPIAIDKTINFDLENNFKNDIANKSLKIYVLENKTNTISQNEFNFQNKYKLTFTTFYKINNDYYQNYNKKVFDFLEDNFNDKWQNEISFDVLGFEQWQNN